MKQKNSTTLIAYYTKKDRIYKIVELMKKSAGTQMKAFYFKDNKPIFVSVKINKFHLTSEITQFSKVLLTFNNVLDTNFIRKKSLYKCNYSAEYFFNQGNVRHANVMRGDEISVDKKRDIEEGLKLFYEGKRYLLAKL